MPSTVNGIGTHYYGKRNVAKRNGTCRQCGAETVLESYDTRLWFVVIFIPIIPLGRKRILDYCNRCTRHFVANAAEYDMQMQLGISGVQEKYRSQPTPETALEVHATFLGFHRVDEADQFRAAVLAQFPEDAPLHAGLAHHLDQTGRYNDATPLYERAHELRPELPEARIGLGMRRLFDNKLPEAEKLLDFLMQPGAGQLYSLVALDNLAHAYDRDKQPAKALAIFEHLLAEFPNAANDHQVRKIVRRLEKATGRDTSALPEQPFSIRALFDSRVPTYPAWVRWTSWLTVWAVLLIGGLATNNEYLRRNRTVHLVNGFEVPVQVQFNDQTPIMVAPGDLVPATLSEGDYQVKFTGPMTGEIPLKMATSYFTRWTSRPVWVVNPGGAAVLGFYRLEYAENPQPTRVELIVAEPLYTAPHIDFPFMESPKQLEIKKNQVKHRTELQTLNYPSVAIVNELSRTQPHKILPYLETQVIAFPENSLNVEMLTGFALNENRTDLAVSILRKQLTVHPENVILHRGYQNLLERTRQTPQLLTEYDALLAQHPGDAKFIYLRARIETDPVQQNAQFEQAAAADPKFAWPRMSLAYAASNRADWETCRRYCAEALALGMDPMMLQEMWHRARLAVDDRKVLEAEYRAQSAQPEAGWTTFLDLIDLLAVQDKPAEGLQQLPIIMGRFFNLNDPTYLPTRRGIEAQVSYMVGDFAGLAQKVQGATGLDTGEMRFLHTSAVGSSVELAEDKSLQSHWDKPEAALKLALALRIEGRPDLADKFLQQACAAWANSDPESQTKAKLLLSQTAPTASEVLSNLQSIEQKLLLIGTMVLRFPELQAELVPILRTMNISRQDPHHLIERLLKTLPPPAA